MIGYFENGNLLTGKMINQDGEFEGLFEEN